MATTSSASAVVMINGGTRRITLSAVTLINSPGTIDSDYRGELLVPLVNLGDAPFTLSRGERIAQILFAPVPVVCLEVVEALPHDTVRGTGGFGSTGRD